MGLFSRKRQDAGARDDTADRSSGIAADGTIPLEVFEGRPVTSPLTDVERQRIADGLARLVERGVDVDDLDSIGAGFDAARARWLADPTGEGADVIVELLGVAIGEHLARHSARQWAVVTDVFGTDLGLASARAETVVVPHNLISARWMRGETGWVPGVVGHLVRLAPRR